MSNSLDGLRILNTRPKEQAQMLSKHIIDAGGIVIACPTLEIKATSEEWLRTLPDLNTIDHAIFISANAVRYCFNPLKQQGIHWPEHIKIIAIGLGTAAALKEYGININELPDAPDSEHVLALESLQSLKNQSVLVIKGCGGRPLIEAQLRQREAKLLSLVVYERQLPQIPRQFIDSIWHNDLVDVILITSEQSLHHLFKMFGEEALHWLHSKTYVLISERLAKAASLLGIKKMIISHPNHMINTLFEYYKGLTHGQQN